MKENRILIVDDDPRICRLIRRIAQGLGHQTCIVDTSEEFESAFRQFQPNVIVLDLQMGEIDGIILLRYLASQQVNASIILISGVDGCVIDSAQRYGQSVGLNIVGTLRKPIEVDELKDRLAREPQQRPAPVGTTGRFSETELAWTIEHGDLVVHYQPQISLLNDEITGVEALAWLRHPEHKLVAPEDFIPVAEERGLIGDFTYKVLATAIRDVQRWHDTAPDISLAVNLSAKMLHDLQLPDRIGEILQAHDFNPERLVLEVTESAAMDDPARTIDILTRLRLKGVKLSIDDFGTGYSSLVQLYRLPFSEIKVDRSFVMEAKASKEAATIVDSIVALGRRLELAVIAEGIENRETYDWLRDLGCDVGQGHHMSPPLEADSFACWLTQWPRAHFRGSSGQVSLKVCRPNLG